MDWKVELSEFKSITLDVRELFQQYFRMHPRRHCEFNFNTLFCWDPIVNYRYTIENDLLLLYSARYELMYMPLGGSILPEDLVHIFQNLQRQGKKGIILLLDRDYADQHPQLASHFVLESDRNNADYIYESIDLVELKGRKLHKKKNLLSQFTNTYSPYYVELIIQPSFEICQGLAERWWRNKETLDDPAESERSAIRRCLHYFTQLDVKGLTIRCGDTLVACSIFSQQSEDTYCIHFEKFDLEYKGSAQVINWETARYIHSLGIRYIDREQDMGNEGLRQAKLSYQPCRLLEPYRLIPRD